MSEKEIFADTEKAFIAQLPRYAFEGKIVVVDSMDTLPAALERLRQAGLVGLDTETRPTFRRGEVHRVALLQMGCEDVCYLVRLCRIGLPPAVVSFLEDKSVTKVGLSLKDDLLMLSHRAQFKPAGFVELQDVAARLGTNDRSLQKLYANFFHQRIAKGARLTNWEAPNLTEAQRTYAATDAVACVKLYREMMRLCAAGVKAKAATPEHAS